MEESQSSLEQALTAIRTFGFQHPDDQLLECFVRDSVDHEATARYVLRKYFGEQEDVDLMSLLSDWKELVGSVIEQFSQQNTPKGDVVINVAKRDNHTCCITGLESSLVDPLIVTPIFPVVRFSGESMQELFDLFTGSDIQERIQANDGRSFGVQNHWLVRKSAAKALAQGYFRFTSTRGSDYRVSQVTIGGPNRPSIVERIPVQQLPLGMYLKTAHHDDHQALANEFGALKLVRSQTQVPVPRPLDLVSDADASYLLTTTMPGQRLGFYIDMLSDDDLDIFKHDMQEYMAQLRSVSRQGE
ncbi:hypothetical protein FNYG_11523 [Fusarium nygamai]|uniref:Uncharacterized protein n=1 Tax=Gibberella nygamai TaxID=42673 RepID=A0A2K0VYP9_GIBNY|nr:hypothetical protein FNYG_11523 [Fusarium nygamai]